MDNTRKMGEKGQSWWQRHRPSTRRLIQLYSALLHNAYLKGFITGDIYKGNGKYICAPGFNCYSCPAAAAACPLGSIQNALGSADHRAGWYVLGIILLYGVILGRTICGWLCPLGLIQELLNKVPTLKLKKNAVTRALTWLKYVLLAVFVIAIPLWYSLAHGIPLPGFCKYICPAGTFEGAMGLLSNPVNAPKFSMLGVLFTRKFIIMLGIGLLCVFCYRAFCRFICPLGAIYGLFNRFNIIGVKVDENRCNHCGACVRGCGMDVRHVGDHECINCGKCMASCNQGAISIKAGKITLKAPEKGCAGDGPDAPNKRKQMARILWTIALLALCFALLWFNVLDPAAEKGVVTSKKSGTTVTTATQAPAATEIPAATEVPTATEVPAEAAVPAATEAPAKTEAPAVVEVSEKVNYDSDAPVGCEVGEQLPDFTVTCYDGSTFHLKEQRGKVTFINFWATHCTPCIQELPHFDALYRAHEDDIAMIAIHSYFVTKDPEEFLADKGYAISFAHDSDNSLMDMVKGTGTLPQTVVLNRKGEVIYNKVGSVTPELLEALYEEAAGPTATEVPAETAVPAEAKVPAETEAPAVVEVFEKVSYDSDAPVGCEVGEQLPDFTVPCYDGSTFHLKEQRGKVTFINFWATHCTPCIQELPHFDALYRAHEDDIAMIAIHSYFVTKDPEEFLADKGYVLSFAHDSDNSLMDMVKGTGTLPQTVVLNRKGEVIYNKVGSVTPELLEALYEEAAGPTGTELPAEAAVPTVTKLPTETETFAETEAPAVVEVSEEVSYDSDAPVGCEVGEQLPDFTVTCYDGSTFHLKDQRGKVTFINFWATHCTPCIQELPHFDALYRAHEDDIAMIAIHSYFVTKDPEEFLADKGYVLSFAHDSDNSLMDMVKGTGTLPQTVVLNRKGEVIYNKVGSVTPELLEALYEEAAK